MLTCLLTDGKGVEYVNAEDLEDVVIANLLDEMFSQIDSQQMLFVSAVSVHDDLEDIFSGGRQNVATPNRSDELLLGFGAASDAPPSTSSLDPFDMFRAGASQLPNSAHAAGPQDGDLLGGFEGSLGVFLCLAALTGE
jgi:hypothetical protein